MKDIRIIPICRSHKNPNRSRKNKTPFIQVDKLKEFINSIQYPLYFLDFETVNPAIPIYPKAKPYQHTPFYILFMCRLIPIHQSNIIVLSIIIMMILEKNSF